jgi:glutathione peroxidase
LNITALRRHFLVLAAIATLLVAGQTACSQDQEQKTSDEKTKTSKMKPIDIKAISFNTIDGTATNLAAFDGKVKLILNVASECGNTPQYKDLEALYRRYKDRGFVVIGFPANNFGGQEPGSNEQILEFCTSRYDVTFPMMAKISVKGEDKHPLFKALSEDSPIPGEISWNFAKFLLDRDGKLVARFDPKVQPMSDEVVGSIEKLLDTKE